jgi:hypothetical protein
MNHRHVFLNEMGIKILISKVLSSLNKKKCPNVWFIGLVLINFSDYMLKDSNAYSYLIIKDNPREFIDFR